MGKESVGSEAGSGPVASGRGVGNQYCDGPPGTRKIAPDLRKTQGMAKRGPAPLLTPELAGEILSHLEEGLSVAETARAVSQPDRRVRNWISRGRLQTMTSKAK